MTLSEQYLRVIPDSLAFTYAHTTCGPRREPPGRSSPRGKSRSRRSFWATETFAPPRCTTIAREEFRRVASTRRSLPRSDALRDAFKPETVEALATAFHKSWGFISKDPRFAVENPALLQRRLSECLMQLAADGEHDPLRLANGAITQMRRGCS
jgi:hypothetical protein